MVGPDGSQWASTLASVNLNPDYWTIAPGWAVSYLDANWLLSANFRYDINTASRGVTMGAPFLGGAGNGFVSATSCLATSPLSTRSANGRSVRSATSKRRPRRPSRKGVTCTPAICGMQSQVALGGLVGYDFGPVAVQVWFDQTVECQNAVCGLDVWARMNFRIWPRDREAAGREELTSVNL